MRVQGPRVHVCVGAGGACVWLYATFERFICTQCVRVCAWRRKMGVRMYGGRVGGRWGQVLVCEGGGRGGGGWGQVLVCGGWVCVGGGGAGEPGSRGGHSAYWSA